MLSLVTSRIAAAALTAVGSLTLLIPASPAQAKVALVTCGGSQTTTYNPGLTNTAQTVQRAGQNIHTPCVSTAPPFTFSGSTSFTSTSALSCLSLTAANTGTDLITWSTGRTSTFSYNRTVTVVQGQTIVTLTGSITAGDFQGATAEETITSVSLDLAACSSTQGITSTYGVSELTILG
ncbi:hypothetical protein ACFY8O_29980 [Streptomyces argenteolus]|uniref:Ig-like domain-containing protein n=1 Tax=Streptomyces argenteolus TaxID=67274 RepID=A0ABW6XEH9_9ACTN